MNHHDDHDDHDILALPNQRIDSGHHDGNRYHHFNRVRVIKRGLSIHFDAISWTDESRVQSLDFSSVF